MPCISTTDVIRFLLLLDLQQKRSQVTTQPIRRPTTASTAASQIGTVSAQSEVRGRAVLCSVGAEVVVVGTGKLFTFVKMKGCSWNT